MSVQPSKSAAPAAAKRVSNKSTNDIDRHVGARVRQRRREMKQSQEDLAEGIGVTYQQLQKYESGSNRIGASRLQQIAQVLEIPPQWFFEGAPVQEGALPPPLGDLGPFETLEWTEELLELARAFVAAPKPVKRALVEMCRAIVEAEREREAS